MELQGKGARLHLERTQVTYRRGDAVTVLPLDQVDHIEGGPQPGRAAWLAAGILVVLAGVAGYFYAPVAPWAAPVAGILVGGALIAAYFLQGGHRIRLVSAAGRIDLRVGDPKQAGTFMRALLTARTEYLEGPP